MNRNWKYISLYFAGSKFDYIYDLANGNVYTQLFPGINVEPFTLSCGYKITGEILATVIRQKLGLMELQKTNSIQSCEDYSQLF